MRRSLPATSKSSTSMQKTDSFISRLIDGAALIFPSISRSYVDPTGGGYAVDAEAMKMDFGNMAKDMRRAVKKYEQTEAN